MSRRKRTGNWEATGSSCAERTRLPSGSLCFQMRATRTCDGVAICEEVITPLSDTKTGAESVPAAVPPPAISPAAARTARRHRNLERITHRDLAEEGWTKYRAGRIRRRFTPKERNRREPKTSRPVIAHGERQPHARSGSA